jgi:hypothetical protein
MAAPAPTTAPAVSAPPAPQSAANVPVVEEARRPPGVLKKQPPATPSTSAPVAGDDPRVRFETPAPVTQPAGVVPATTTANVPSRPASTQPPMQAATPSTAIPQAVPPASVSQPNVHPIPVESIPAQTAKPVRERPVVSPGPVMPTPAPTVSHDAPQSGAHHNVPSGTSGQPTGGAPSVRPATSSGGAPALDAPVRPPSSGMQNVPSAGDASRPISEQRPPVSQKPTPPSTVQQTPATVPAAVPVQNITPGSSSGNVAPVDPVHVPASDPAHRPNVLKKPPPQPTIIQELPQPTTQQNVPGNTAPGGVDVVEGQAVTGQPAAKPNVLKKPPPPTKVVQPGQPIETVANVRSGSDPATAGHTVPVPADGVTQHDGSTAMPPVRKGLPTAQGTSAHPSGTGPGEPRVGSKQPTVVPGQTPGGATQSISPEAALAERDRIAGESGRRDNTLSF